jgi:hypothetical protein
MNDSTEIERGALATYPNLIVCGRNSNYHKKGVTAKNNPINVPPMMYIWNIFGYSSFVPQEKVLRIHTL